MHDHDIIYEQLLKQTAKENISRNMPLKDFTYTRLGGHADFFVTPTSFTEVQQIIKYAYNGQIPFTLLGNGSNLIIRDGGIRGIVMNLTHLNEIKVEGTIVTAQSGARIIDASRKARDAHLTGLEFACGIPGSVGGALFMNAGAYGGEVKDVLIDALLIDEKGEFVRLENEALDLSYRTSKIQTANLIALEATFELKEGNLDEINAVMADLTEKRETKQPLEYPSCGSVFKRPPGYFAGKLIQDSGLQGYSIGDAQVSVKHAGFIVNKNKATAKNYTDLIQHVQKVVKERYGVTLEREVRIIGEDLE